MAICMTSFLCWHLSIFPFFGAVSLLSRKLAGAYRSFDLDGDGIIDRDEFRFGMRKMNEVRQFPPREEGACVRT